MSANHEASRRTFFIVSGTAVATAGLVLPYLFRTNHFGGQPNISWEQVIELVDKLSTNVSQTGLPNDQLAYVSSVEKIVKKLSPSASEQVRFKATAFNVQIANRARYEARLLCLEEGQHIPLHDHPQLTGVSMCLNGAVEMDNFVPAAAAEGKIFRIKRTSSLLLRAGDCHSLTEDVDCLHRLRASQKSVILDIFTPAYDTNRLLKTRKFYLDHSETQDIYEAHVI